MYSTDEAIVLSYPTVCIATPIEIVAAPTAVDTVEVNS